MLLMKNGKLLYDFCFALNLFVRQKGNTNYLNRLNIKMWLLVMNYCRTDSKRFIIANEYTFIRGQSENDKTII